MISRITSVLVLLIFAGSAAQAAPGDKTTSAIGDFSGGGQPGHSTLVRTPNGLSAHWASTGTGIVPGFVYTVWYVVFNEPDDCISPDGMGGTMCGEIDVFVEPETALVDILFAGGAIAGNDAWSRIGGHRKRGDNSVSVYTFLGFADTPGLINPDGAEVHLVLRSHGPAVPDQLADQLDSFEGGCTTFLDPPAIPDAEGECADIQFSVHVAP